MDRSRSPHRNTAPVAGTRPLVNFPVWSGPNTSDNNPRGPGLQSGQTSTQHWHQGPRGLQPSQGLPVTQDSQQIPPGQVGQSQQFVGMSQQSGYTPPTQGWSPGYGTPVAPRPQVHGIGLGGMVTILSSRSTYLDLSSIPWTSSWPISTTTIWTRYPSFFSETYSGYTIKSIELRNSTYSCKNTNGQNPKLAFGPTLET